MTRVPVVAIAILLGCVGGVGYVYQQTRPKTEAAPPAAATPVVKIDRVREAVAKTSSVKSFTFDFTIEYTAGSADSFQMTGDGSADLAHKLVSVTSRVPQAPPGSAASQPTTVLVDYSNGFVEYLSSHMLDGRLPAGATWVRIDVGKYAKQAGIDLASLERGNDADPTRILDVLRKSGDPVLVGTEAVNGVSTTHYHSTVDIQRLIDGETDPVAKKSLERAVKLTNETMYPIDVWIDDSGYLRRVQTFETQTLPDDNTPVTVRTTEDLGAFGAPVHVAVPAAGVTDVESLR